MTLASSSSRYWRASRAPRYSVTFAFPLLVAYEALAFTLSHEAMTGVRNGADVLLKSAFILLGGRNGLIAFGVLVVGTGLVLAWRDRRRSGIATALKSAQIAWAAENGFRRLVTYNDEANGAMRGINDRLGYEPQPPVVLLRGPLAR